MAPMTFWQFAGEHPVQAMLFAVLAAAVAVVLGGLFIAWRVSRPVKYTAADRGALTQAAALLRTDAQPHKGYSGHDDRVAAAERLERMAGR